ncbi:MAG: hypothetical protein JW734_10175 [Candidatus Omnitrophica bacterium]|nr:hypothetical protein [Candidatus Omnitrophota bacterium]
MRKRILPFLLIIMPYLLVLFFTQLDWGLFRDEHRYLDAVKVMLQEGRFMMNVCGPGVALWSFLWHIAGYNPAICRLTVFVLGLLSIYTVFHLGGYFGYLKPWHYAVFLASIPHFFMYSFQVNGLVIAIAFSLLTMVCYFNLVQRRNQPISFSFWLMVSGIFIFSLLGCATSPFVLAYPATIILFELIDIFRNKYNLKVNYLIIGVCALSVILWVFYAFYLSEGFGAIERHGFKHCDVNIRLGLIYPGHVPVFFIFFGGFLPFLLLGLPRKVSMKIFIPILAIIIGIFAAYSPSQINTTTLYSFYTIFFTFINFIIVTVLNLSAEWNKLFIYILLSLGVYNFLNLIYQCRKDFYYYFSLILLCVYMAFALIQPYIGSRLYLPGMLGFLFVALRAYHKYPRLLYWQLSYQVFMSAVYVYSLYIKWGIFASGIFKY